jgi:competence protein ComEA
MNEDSINISELLERYRLQVGLFLVLLILAGCGLLYYRGSYNKVRAEEKIGALSDRISGMERELASLKDTVKNEGTKPVPDQPVVQADIPSASNTVAATTQSKPVVSGHININTASAAELDTLPGIGETYAKRIIEYREANGGFKAIEDIMKVKGIGEKTFEKFRDKITIE